MEKRGNILYVVVPCYNEEEVLEETARQLEKKMTAMMEEKIIALESKVLFLNDGSKDHTWEIMERLHKENPLFGGISLSRNRGHQNVLLAGYMTAKEKADMVISMDADLQDDMDVMQDMVEKYRTGIDIVYGVRKNRKQDSFFKKTTSEGFYKVMKFLGADTVYNHADYRLMSKRALEGLAQFKEVNLFLRGVIPLIGYPSDFVYYERGKRLAGKTKYPLPKMMALAMEGITSFSVKPIRLISLLGFVIFFLSIIMLVYSFIRHFMGATIVGWTTLMVSVWAIGGLILLALGIVGEYIGKIYLETKGRPRFIIEKILDETGEEDR